MKRMIMTLVAVWMMITSMNAQRLTKIQAEARFITDKMVVELGLYIKGKSGSLCWNGSQYDWCKEKYHCGGSRPISICYGKSSYYKEDRSIYYKGFHHRNAGSLKSGFAVSYFRTVGTRNPDYLVSAGASSLHKAIKLFWTFRVPWDGHTLQKP